MNDSRKSIQISRKCFQEIGKGIHDSSGTPAKCSRKCDTIFKKTSRETSRASLYFNIRTKN